MSELAIELEQNSVTVVEKELNYDKISLKKKNLTLVQSATLVYQQKGQFNIYELKILKGQLNPPVYLITHPNIHVRNEKNWLNITPFKKPKLKAHFDDHKILDCMYEHYSKEITLGKDEHWKDLSKDEKWTLLYQSHLLRLINKVPIFYKLQPELTKEELEEIKSWDFEKLEHDYFYEGKQKDKDLIYVYRPEVISFETNPYRTPDTCKNVQPFNSNAIVVTPTGRGKTWLGRKIGRLYTDASSARMTGFSTANEINIGELDGEYKSVALDNVHNYTENILKGILELMETGETNVAKGKAPVITRTTSPFIIHANPPETTNPTVLAQSFIEILNLMNKVTPAPVLKRFPIISFSTDATLATGKPLNREIVDKNQIVFEYIINEVNKEVEKNIFSNEKVQNFLTTMHERTQIYAKQVEKFLVDDITTNLKLWLHQAKYGYQHVQASALKHAIIDNLKEIYTGKYSIDKILSDAEEHVTIICNLNIKSLQNLLDTVGQVPLEQYIYDKYENIKDFNAKAIVLVVALYVKMNPNAIKDAGMKLPLEVLSNYYDEHLPDDIKSKGYHYFSNVIHKLPNNLEKFNRKLGDFGFHLVKYVDSLNNQDLIDIVFTKKTGQLKILSKKLFAK